MFNFMIPQSIPCVEYLCKKFTIKTKTTRKMKGL